MKIVMVESAYLVSIKHVFSLRNAFSCLLDLEKIEEKKTTTKEPNSIQKRMKETNNREEKKDWQIIKVRTCTYTYRQKL